MIPLSIIPDKVNTVINKNSSVSYGLTIVAGCPLSIELTRTLQCAQNQLEESLPGRFNWYQSSQFHITLAALLRGRYRVAPALQHSELPGNLVAFSNDVMSHFASTVFISFHLKSFLLTNSGYILVQVHHPEEFQQAIIHRFTDYPELDLPPQTGMMHITIGYLNTLRPFRSETERTNLISALETIQQINVGPILIDHAWLIHYANRTLNRLIGKLYLPFGQALTISPQMFIDQLGIE